MVFGFWQFMGNRLILFRDGLIALTAVSVLPRNPAGARRFDEMEMQKIPSLVRGLLFFTPGNRI